MTVHNTQHLFADIQGALQRSRLDEILKTPGIGKLIVLPGIENCEQGDVIALRLVKLCLALVGNRLLVL